jgi:hypothetical protein
MDMSTCLLFKRRHSPHLLSLCLSSGPGRGAVHSAFLLITGRSQYRNQHGSSARQIAALKLPEDSARDPYFPGREETETWYVKEMSSSASWLHCWSSSQSRRRQKHRNVSVGELLFGCKAKVCLRS